MKRVNKDYCRQMSTTVSLMLLLLVDGGLVALNSGHTGPGSRHLAGPR